MSDQPSKPEPSTKQKILAGLTLGLVVVVAAVILSSVFGGGDDETTAAPAFNVVSDETAGVTRNLVVEVETADDLRGVFDAVLDQYGDDDAAYFVTINCSTGAETTGLGDNRLANGRAAVGRDGEAGTGLADGAVDFQVVDNRTCPA